MITQPFVSEKFDPIALMTGIVKDGIARIRVVDPVLADELFTGLGSVVVSTRFHLLCSEEQYRDVWDGIRKKSDDLVNLILTSLIRFHFEVSTPRVAGDSNTRGFDNVLDNLRNSFAVFTAGEVLNSAIDDVLLDRLFTDENSLLESNKWIVVLLLLSMSNDFVKTGHGVSIK